MDDTIESRLRLLHDEYASAVNAAIDNGRLDLVDELVADFPDAALALLTAEAA